MISIGILHRKQILTQYIAILVAEELFHLAPTARGKTLDELVLEAIRMYQSPIQPDLGSRPSGPEGLRSRLNQSRLSEGSTELANAFETNPKRRRHGRRIAESARPATGGVESGQSSVRGAQDGRLARLGIRAVVVVEERLYVIREIIRVCREPAAIMARHRLVSVLSVAIERANCDHDERTDAPAVVEFLEHVGDMPALSYRSTREEAGVTIIHVKNGVSVDAFFIVAREKDVDLPRCVVRSRHLDAVVRMKEPCGVTVVVEPTDLSTLDKSFRHQSTHPIRIVVEHPEARSASEAPQQEAAIQGVALGLTRTGFLFDAKFDLVYFALEEMGLCLHHVPAHVLAERLRGQRPFDGLFNARPVSATARPNVPHGATFRDYQGCRRSENLREFFQPLLDPFVAFVRPFVRRELASVAARNSVIPASHGNVDDARAIVTDGSPRVIGREFQLAGRANSLRCLSLPSRFRIHFMALSFNPRGRAVRG